VAGFARVFRLVSVSCILHGYSNPARKEYGTGAGAGGLGHRTRVSHLGPPLQTATCAAARREDSHLLVALFDVDPDELPAFFEREHRLRCLPPALSESISCGDSNFRLNDHLHSTVVVGSLRWTTKNTRRTQHRQLPERYPRVASAARYLNCLTLRTIALRAARCFAPSTPTRST
jgi:hypothetical protein